MPKLGSDVIELETGGSVVEPGQKPTCTPRMYRLAHAIATSTKTIADIAAEHGLVPETVYAWMRRDDYRALVARMTKQKVEASLSDIDSAMVRKAIDQQDVPAAKLCYQRAGIILDDSGGGQKNIAQVVINNVIVGGEKLDGINARLVVEPETGDGAEI